jgi:hypothetical protein
MREGPKVVKKGGVRRHFLDIEHDVTKLGFRTALTGAMATLLSIMRRLGFMGGIGAPCRQAAFVAVEVAACLFAIGGMTTQAHATCGDWLAHPSEPQDPSSPTSPDTGVNQTAPQRTPDPAPCSGPSCGRKPWAPTPATPIQLQTVGDQFAALDIGAECKRTERRLLLFAFDGAPNAGFWRRIEHPPRA